MSDLEDLLPTQIGGTGSGVSPIPAGSSVEGTRPVDIVIARAIIKVENQVARIAAPLEKVIATVKEMAAESSHKIAHQKFQGGMNIMGPFSWPYITLEELAANVNDYSIPHDNGINFRISSSAAVDITGILAPNWDGHHLRLTNVGANNITLKDQNGGSAAANQIITGTGADIIMTPDYVAVLNYDLVSQLWRVQP